MLICLPQVDKFVSWHPDPDAFAIDAFSVSWAEELIYAFPCFSLIERVVQKLRQDQGELILVAPVWLTQGWFTAVMELLIDKPRIFKVHPDTLSLQHSHKIHPLVNHLHLMACRLSGKRIKAETFRKTLLKSSWRNSTKKQYSSYINRWISYCNKREINPIFTPLSNVIEFLTDMFHSGYI